MAERVDFLKGGRIQNKKVAATGENRKDGAKD